MKYQTLKGVCFFEGAALPESRNGLRRYQTLKGVCFFEGGKPQAPPERPIEIPDAERRLLL